MRSGKESDLLCSSLKRDRNERNSDDLSISASSLHLYRLLAAQYDNRVTRYAVSENGSIKGRAERNG
jgi:hypothetical protein